MKERLIKGNALPYIVRLGLGLFVGYELSLTPTPLLHYLLYRDVLSMLWVLVIIFGLSFAIFIAVSLPKPFALTKKKARKTLFLGISISAFILGFWTFINYPTILSSNYNWLPGGNIHLTQSTQTTVDVTVGALIFFIASILWDTLIGAFFAVLEHLLT